MKIIVTGSLGHISKPLTLALVQKGNQVTVISSNPERQKDIEALGATAAIGSIEDEGFLAGAFTGADAVYTMIPPANFSTPDFDLMAHCRKLSANYSQAIKRAGVRRVVHLSSIGAHMEKDSGLILFHRQAELALSELSDVAITFIRPVGFFYNLYGFMPAIKNQGFIAANYGADDVLVWVSPLDIAAAVAEELLAPVVHRKIRYVASDELTGNETARILGEAIGKPELKWILIPGEQWQSALQDAGVNPQIAAGIVQMFASQHGGALMEDYYRNRPALGKVKLTEFAKEFAVAFDQK